MALTAKITAVAAAAALALTGGLAIQMAQGNDPALSAKTKQTQAVANTSTASQSTATQSTENESSDNESSDDQSTNQTAVNQTTNNLATSAPATVTTRTS